MTLQTTQVFVTNITKSTKWIISVRSVWQI